jgi:hypothetical protein
MDVSQVSSCGIMDTSKEDELAANLVVDASGGGSRSPQWFASLGYDQVEESGVPIHVGYASRLYRCPNPQSHDWKVLIVLGTPPDNKRAGVIFLKADIGWSRW